MIYGMALISAIAVKEQYDGINNEYRAWLKCIENLPEEERNILIENRRAAMEKARKDANEERRHQDICDAIRSTSFWRF